MILCFHYYHQENPSGKLRMQFESEFANETPKKSLLDLATEFSCPCWSYKDGSKNFSEKSAIMCRNSEEFCFASVLCNFRKLASVLRTRVWFSITVWTCRGAMSCMLDLSTFLKLHMYRKSQNPADLFWYSHILKHRYHEKTINFCSPLQPAPKQLNQTKLPCKSCTLQFL